MRSLEYEFIKKVFLENNLDIKEFETFVETGTYKGDTVFENAKHFKELHTIEICKNAHKYCKNLAEKKKINNINFVLGDSALELKNIINNVKEKNTIYFLDGHVTDNKSGYTGKGVIDCPLLEELKQICEYSNGKSVIIIDDTRLLGRERNPSIKKGTANCDWSNITFNNIKNSLNEKRVEKIYFTEGARKIQNDRIIIILSAI